MLILFWVQSPLADTPLLFIIIIVIIQQRAFVSKYWTCATCILKGKLVISFELQHTMAEATFVCVARSTTLYQRPQNKEGKTTMTTIKKRKQKRRWQQQQTT